MTAVRELYSFLRWRLVPVRYAGKIARSLSRRPASVFRQPVVEEIEVKGHAPGPTLSGNMLADIQATFAPRAAAVKPRETGHPFENLVRPEDFSADSPLMHFAFSPEVLDVAHEYFGGRFILDSIQVLHSWPTGERVADSQLWHLDYGDSRTLHCVAYLNDVLDADGGPFVFVDKADTRRIAKRPIIRRIRDEQFDRELAGGNLRTFCGRAGDSVFVDPSACYHYGSRCKTPRLAIFVTFYTDRPFVPPTEPIRANRARLLEVAKAIRPDLTEAYLRRLLEA